MQTVKMWFEVKDTNLAQNIADTAAQDICCVITNAKQLKHEVHSLDLHGVRISDALKIIVSTVEFMIIIAYVYCIFCALCAYLSVYVCVCHKVMFCCNVHFCTKTSLPSQIKLISAYLFTYFLFIFLLAFLFIYFLAAQIWNKIGATG